MKLPILLGLVLSALVPVTAAVPKRLTRKPDWSPLRTEAGPHSELVSGAQARSEVAEAQVKSDVTAAKATAATAEGVPWWHTVMYGVGGLLGGAVIGFLLLKLMKKEESKGKPKEAQAEDAPGESGVTEGEDAPAAAAAVDVPAAAPPAAPLAEGIDFEKLLRMLSQRAAQKVGPKLAKAQAVRCIVEDRITTLKRKAMGFLFNEFNGTAAELLRAMEAEEAMILFDWNSAVGSKLPPASVLLAGLLAPTILTIRQVGHILQLVLGLVPIMILCAWAAYDDLNTVCVIPTIYEWTYVQGGLALVLSLGHLMMYVQIASGKKGLSAKAEAMNERVKAAKANSSQDMGYGEMRELCVGSTVLLEQALLVEDQVRHSIWHKINGAGSVIWLLTVVWNFVIVMGWTFWPGLIAFHPKAAKVAPDEYCGALTTVLVARIVCILHLIFLAISIITMAGWLSDMMIDSPTYGNGLLKAAKKADEGMLGIPVMQILVKAFVLRGGADMVSSQLVVAADEKAALQRERDQAQSQVQALRSQIESCKAEEVALKKKAGITDEPDLEASIDPLPDAGGGVLGEMQEQGASAVSSVQARATAMEEATVKELEAMMKKIMEAFEGIQNSEAYKSAMAQAQEAMEQAQEAAQDAMEQAQEAAQDAMEQAQDAMEQAQDAMEDAVAQASEMAGQLNAENLQGAMAQAQEAMEQAQAAAQEAAEQASEMAGNLNAETLQGAVAHAQEAMEQAHEAMEEAMEDAAAQASEMGGKLNAENLQSAMAQAQEAMEQAQEATQEAMEQAQEAAEAGAARASEAAKELASSETVLAAQASVQQAAEEAKSAASAAAEKVQGKP